LSGLYALPFLFWLWASIHIQFIHGLIVLAMFAFEFLLNWLVRYKSVETCLPTKSVFVFLACVLATLLTPYTLHLSATLFQYAAQKNIYQSISEMLAISFREPFHFAIPILALGAAMALGWSRNLRPMYLALLLFGVALGFRSIKDSWIL